MAQSGALRDEHRAPAAPQELLERQSAAPRHPFLGGGRRQFVLRAAGPSSRGAWAATGHGWTALTRPIAITSAGVAGTCRWVLATPGAAVAAATLAVPLCRAATSPAPLVVRSAGGTARRRRYRFARQRRKRPPEPRWRRYRFARHGRNGGAAIWVTLGLALPLTLGLSLSGGRMSRGPVRGRAMCRRTV